MGILVSIEYQIWPMALQHVSVNMQKKNVLIDKHASVSQYSAPQL